MDKARLNGPIHRLGDWIITYFVRLPRWIRIPLWRFWHASMIRWDGDYQSLRFMNYGYAPVDGSSVASLHDADESINGEAYGALLYEKAVSWVQIEDRHVLEVSSGRGGGASHLARTRRPRRYVGLDISGPNVAGCRRAYSSLDNLTFVQGTAERLPFDDDSFDYVLSVEASRAYGSIAAFLSQVRRVLRPDGRFLLTDMRRPEDIGPLRRTIESVGFRWEHHEDITPNVVRALERDNDRKVALMRRRVPPMFLSTFSEFAGTVGSDRYRDFRDGHMRYFSWCLRPS